MRVGGRDGIDSLFSVHGFALFDGVARVALVDESDGRARSFELDDDLGDAAVRIEDSIEVLRVVARFDACPSGLRVARDHRLAVAIVVAIGVDLRDGADGADAGRCRGSHRDRRRPRGLLTRDDEWKHDPERSPADRTRVYAISGTGSCWRSSC